MVVRSEYVVASLVVKAVIHAFVQVVYGSGLYSIDEVDLLELLDLNLFINVEEALELVQSLGCGHGKLRFLFYQHYLRRLTR